MFLISLMNYSQPSRIVLVPHTSALALFFRLPWVLKDWELECQVPSGWVGPIL